MRNILIGIFYIQYWNIFRFFRLVILIQFIMSKFNEFKDIIKNDTSQQAPNKFLHLADSVLTSSPNPVLKQDELDLLLRWTVQEQKKKFSVFYNKLKQMGANVNFTDKGEKKSILMIACEGNTLEIVETLASDPDINFKCEDSSKKNCLFYAIENKNKEKGEKFVRAIIKNCPKILTTDKTSKKNKTPLITAVEKGRLQIVKTLLELGADPNEKINDNGNTPIYEAVKVMKLHYTQINKQIVQCLLNSGADPSIRNKQNKNAIDVAEKYENEVLGMIEEANREKVTPDYAINSVNEREEMFAEAARIFEDMGYLIELSDNSSEESEIEQEEDDDPYEDPHIFVESLSQQIIEYAHQCQNNHQNAKKDLEKFLQILAPISQSLNLHIEVYGSFATKLWLKHCDIDLLLRPKEIYLFENVEGYLDEIYCRLMSVSQTSRKFQASMLKTIKVPMIRVQMSDKDPNNHWDRKKNPRKFDITIMDRNHNGQQHVMYISQLMHCYPYLQPIFYVIKKLSYTFKLNDPKQNGVRSYALILMIAYFLQEYQIDPTNNPTLGQVLLSFLRKYGYLYEYEFIQNPDVHKSLMLTLADPINIKNNVGNQTDAYSLQKMFRTGYLILHTKGCDSKLSLLFNARNMFGPLSY